MKKFLALSLSYVVFLMLINVKMPTINCWHFNIYEQDKFHAQLSWAWIKFYNSGLGHLSIHPYVYLSPIASYMHSKSHTWYIGVPFLGVACHEILLTAVILCQFLPVILGLPNNLYITCGSDCTARAIHTYKGSLFSFKIRSRSSSSIGSSAVNRAGGSLALCGTYNQVHMFQQLLYHMRLWPHC